MEQLDTELADLAQPARWREWMARVEAALFSSGDPVGANALARLVGRNCAVELLIEDIAVEIRDRPYEIVRVAGGWQFRTKSRYAEAIRRSRGEGETQRDLTRTEALVLTAVAYLQPVTRTGISRLMGREVSRDLIGRLHRQGLIARGPRSPEPGAPHTLVTTAAFLTLFGLDSLRDLPDLESLEDAGLLQPDDPNAMPIAGEGPE